MIKEMKTFLMNDFQLKYNYLNTKKEKKKQKKTNVNEKNTQTCLENDL